MKRLTKSMNDQIDTLGIILRIFIVAILFIGPMNALAISDESADRNVFIRGIDNTVRYKVWDSDNNTWSNWINIGGYATSDPDAISEIWRRFSSVDVFVRGRNNTLSKKSWSCGDTGCKWGNWTNLGGYLTSEPSAIVSDILGDRFVVYVFVRGRDNALWHLSNGDNKWTRLGGYLTSAPGATYDYNTDKIHVFARGKNNTLLYKSAILSSDSGTSFNVTWKNWTNLGGYLTSEPDATVFGNRIFVFIRGRDNALYYKTSANSNTWTSWKRLGGNLTSGPSASHGYNINVFIRGGDKALYYKTSVDGNTWSDWKRLGGILASGPGAMDPWWRTFQPSVTLYENRDYGGKSKTFYGNTPWIGYDFNDIASSLKVTEGYKVTLYENRDYGGKSKTFYGNIPWVGYDFNDIASSLKISI